MSQFDLLQPHRQALQEQHSLLSKKLLELRQNAAYATEAAVRFQLEKQINISLGTQRSLSTVVE